MTYAEKMGCKISLDMAFSSIQDGNIEGERFVNQIIADTKRVDIKSVDIELAGHPGLSNRCAAAIDKAEVTEVEK